MNALPKDDIVWTWNTTKLSASEIGREFSLTKGQVLGIVHRDPRAKMRKPPSLLQIKDRRIQALEAEVARLQDLEAMVLRKSGLKKGAQARMEAEFWKAMRKALYEEREPEPAPRTARMEWKAAA